MVRPQLKRLLNTRPLLLVLLTTALIGSTARPAEAQVESRKSPLGAFALSFIIPGAGQAYNGQWTNKGGVMLVGTVASLLVAEVAAGSGNCWGLDTADGGLDCALGYGAVVAVIGFWLWSWIDAPRSAKAINRRIDAGQVALEIGPQLLAPRSRSAIAGLRSSGPPSFQRSSPFDLSLLRVRF